MPQSLEARVEQLISKIDNQRCADCFDKQPANVVIMLGGLEKPLGAFVCFRCARVHGKFGNDLCYVLNARNENDCKCDMPLIDVYTVIFWILTV